MATLMTEMPDILSAYSQTNIHTLVMFGLVNARAPLVPSARKPAILIQRRQARRIEDSDVPNGEPHNSQPSTRRQQG